MFDNVTDADMPYPPALAKAMLLSLEAVAADDRSGMCAAVLETMSLLSASGVRRDLLHAMRPAGAQETGGLATAAAVDSALGRLTEASLISLSMDGQAVIAHDQVLRVIREVLTGQGRLTPVCQLAAAMLETWTGAIDGSLDRIAVRDFPRQVTALLQSAAGLQGAPDPKLEAQLLGLSLRALYYLNELGDSAEQAIKMGQLLVADCDRVLGPDHPHTLAARDSLASAYQIADRTAEASGSAGTACRPS